MSDGIYVALSGAIAQQAALDTTANNLANASTDAFQRTRPVFREALARAGRAGGSMHYAHVAGQALDTSRGPIRVTGRPLDLAMPARTFLAIETDRGERYTRAGALSVSSSGILQAAHGHAVLGEDGRPLRATGTDAVTVDRSGEVRQADRVIGRLRIVTFDRPEQLAHEGGALLAAPPSAGSATLRRVEIDVGSLEESNAPVVSAMTDLVGCMRTSEAFQRVIDAFRDVDKRAATSVGSST